MSLLPFAEVLRDASRGVRKIPRREFLAEGRHPIIDQGQQSIAGYCNTDEGLCTAVPAIVFGDHTRCVKFVEEPFAAGADGVKILVPLRDNDNLRYLYHALRSSGIPSLGYSRHFKLVKELSFMVPGRDRQDEVVEILDAIEYQISLGEEQLKACDDLVKSRFVEMFGEYCESVRLGDFCSRITKGTTPTTAGFQFQNQGVNFIKVESIDENGAFIQSKIAHVGSDCHEAFARSQLQEGDLLFSIAGAIGRSAVVSGDILPANTNQALAIIRLKEDALLDRVYLRQVLSSDAVRVIAEKTKRGVAQVNLSLKDIGELTLPLPPLPLQQEFATFVRQVDKSKFVVQQQIEKLQLLYDSLAQEYFGGQEA